MQGQGIGGRGHGYHARGDGRPCRSSAVQSMSHHVAVKTAYPLAPALPPLASRIIRSSQQGRLPIRWSLPFPLWPLVSSAPRGREAWTSSPCCSISSCNGSAWISPPAGAQTQAHAKQLLSVRGTVTDSAYAVEHLSDTLTNIQSKRVQVSPHFQEGK